MKLLPKLILSLIILGAVLALSLSVFGYYNMESYLEDMYSYRVVFGAKSIAAMMDPEEIKTIVSEGGDQTEAYAHVHSIMDQLKLDGDITYLSLVGMDEDSVTFYIDCNLPEMGDNPADQMPYATDVLFTEAATTQEALERYYNAWDLHRRGLAIDPPVITDNTFGYNFSSAAPIMDENGELIAVIQYVLDMNDVRTYLNSCLLSMLMIALLVVSASVSLYIMFIRKTVTQPIGKLAEFTENVIAAGQFNTQGIELKTGDEIQELGNSFNYMLLELDRYIHDLTAVTAEKERIGAELSIATQIQADMLPSIFPAFPQRDEFDIYATMTPAKEVGGDFYDFFMVDDRHLAMVIADVSGKGVPAALFMVIGKTLIKDHTVPGVDLGEVFSQVNELLCEANKEGLFITAFEGVLDLVTGELRFVNAGHEPPFLYTSSGHYALQKVRPGFVLAGMEGMCYRPGSITLSPGDKLFQYTDGVTEATSADQELYGMERLEQALERSKALSPKQLLPAVKEDIDAFVGEAEQFDDITMLCVEFKRYMTGNEKEEPDMRELTLDASLSSIPALTEFVDDYLTAHNCPTKVQMQIDIAIDELFSNIANYAYAPATGQATVRIAMDGEPRAVTITFFDRGVPYNPLAKEDPNVALNAEERQIGGLGIFMTKKMMDDMTYEYRDGQNILAIRKVL